MHYHSYCETCMTDEQRTLLELEGLGNQATLSQQGSAIPASSHHHLC
jgi:hypothetical protein